jgi:hypothetical protein
VGSVGRRKERTGRPYGATSPSELWAVENNLNIANMDWQDFAAAVDEDGAYSAASTTNRGSKPQPS